MDFSKGSRIVIPGSWLEVSPYDSEKAAQIFSFGFVKAFIVTENSNQAAPELPFIISIDSLEKAKFSKWQLSENFLGFLWKTSSLVPETPPENIYKIWIEFYVTDLKVASEAFSRMKNWNSLGIFISASDKISSKKLNKLLLKYPLQAKQRPHDLTDQNFKAWDELESFSDAVVEVNPVKAPKLSVIIPHFETPHFLCNVLKHLQAAVTNSPPFEVIVVDDGSSLETFNQISYFARRHLNQLSVRIFRWKEKHSFKDGSKIFRAGASRNWGVAKAQSENIFFIDSDMLTPPDIVNTVLNALTEADVVQFVRKHIPYKMSTEVCSYMDLVNSENLFTEEASYWNTLFEADRWTDLTDYWKYTCTYALALKKSRFVTEGRIRRNFIRYGF